MDVLAAIAEDQGFKYELKSLGWDPLLKIFSYLPPFQSVMPSLPAGIPTGTAKYFINKKNGVLLASSKLGMTLWNGGRYEKIFSNGFGRMYGSRCDGVRRWQREQR